MQLAQTILQWVVAPVAGFVWLIYNRQQAHHTDIEVIKANITSAKEAHDREITEIRETSRAIMAKLDSIESALRK